jgi:sugar lactone lactonase YvrE
MNRELLFIVDYILQCVQVVRTRDINLVGIIGEQGQGVDLEGPNSICVSHDNALLFISDISNHRVQVIKGDNGEHVRTIGMQGICDGQFDKPCGVCISQDDTLLFVSDLGNHRVQVLRTADGTHVHTIGSHGNGPSQLDRPTGLCLSRDGTLLYVSDTINSCIQVFYVGNMSGGRRKRVRRTRRNRKGHKGRKHTKRHRRRINRN